MNRVVYRNLNKAKALGYAPPNVWWSVANVSGNVGKGKLQDHTQSITLRNVTANCQQGGIQRIRREHERAIVAWCIGEVVATDTNVSGMREISINPYNESEFVWRDTRQPIQWPLAIVKFTNAGAFAVK